MPAVALCDDAPPLVLDARASDATPLYLVTVPTRERATRSSPSTSRPIACWRRCRRRRRAALQPLVDDESRGADVKIERIRDGERTGADDEIAVEAPLEIRVGGKALTVVMRTPGHDEELARGFLYAESLVDDAADIVSIARPAALTGDEVGNVVDVTLAPRRARARRRAAVLRVVVVRRVRQERHQRAARARAARLVDADRRRRPRSPRCPIACARRSRCSRAPAACTPRACSPPTARSSSRARTSAATTRSTS